MRECFPHPVLSSYINEKHAYDTLFIKIGAARFELATSRPPAVRATKLRHTPYCLSAIHNYAFNAVFCQVKNGKTCRLHVFPYDMTNKKPSAGSFLLYARQHETVPPARFLSDMAYEIKGARSLAAQRIDRVEL